MSISLVVNNDQQEEKEIMELIGLSPAGKGPVDGTNYLKDLKEGDVFIVRVRNKHDAVQSPMFHVVKHYDYTTLLLPETFGDPTHRQCQLYDQSRFCRVFEFVSLVGNGAPDKKEQEDGERSD